MFNINCLIYHNFFGYGMVLDSNEKVSVVFFMDGKKTIMNTHLTQINNEQEYEKIYSLYIENINNTNEKIKSKEDAERKKQNQKEKLEIIQFTEYEKNKKFTCYNEKLDRLSELLFEDIYLIDDFRFYLQKNRIPLDDKIIEYALYYLGYRMRTKEIVLRNKWSSVEKYFENEVCKCDKYFYNNKFNLQIYNDIIKRLEKKMVLFETSPGVYITQRLMKKLGINKYTLKYFQDDIISIGNRVSFFTVKNICKEIPNNKIIEFASETKQIEKFILSVPNIKSIQSDDGKHIFSFSKKRFTRQLFLEMLFSDMQSMDIYELKNKLEKEYDVIFSIETLIYCVNNSNLYYNEEMEKFIKIKKCF